MTSLPSIDYIRDLFNLCINTNAKPTDFSNLLLFSGRDECAEIFERTFGITPFNYSVTRRRTHPREHAYRIFEFINKPETEIGTAMYWVAMTIYIIRCNITGTSPINLVIDEWFYENIYSPLVANLDTYNLSDHDHIKTILNERIIDLTSKLENICYPFCDFYLRTVACTGYNSLIAFN